jgi:hypothetical protein
MELPVAREVIAKYAFMGPGVELERTLPLDDDERRIIEGRVVTRYPRHGLIAKRRGFLRLSSERLCIVRQYGFRRDRIVEIPRGAITRLEADERPLRIHFRGEKEETIDLLVAAQVARVDGPSTVRKTGIDLLTLRGGGIPESVHGIGTALAAWLAP